MRPGPTEVAKAPLFMFSNRLPQLAQQAPSSLRDLVGFAPGSSNELRHLGPLETSPFWSRRRNKTPHLVAVDRVTVFPEPHSFALLTVLSLPRAMGRPLNFSSLTSQPWRQHPSSPGPRPSASPPFLPPVAPSWPTPSAARASP